MLHQSGHQDLRLSTSQVSDDVHNRVQNIDYLTEYLETAIAAKIKMREEKCYESGCKNIPVHIDEEFDIYCDK